MSQIPSNLQKAIKAVPPAPPPQPQAVQTAAPATVQAAQQAPQQTQATQAAQQAVETPVRDLKPGRFYKGSKSIYYVNGSRQATPTEVEVHYWRLITGAKDWKEDTKTYANGYTWKVMEIPGSVANQLPPCPGYGQAAPKAARRPTSNIIPENKNSPKCVKCGRKNKKVALLISETYYCETCEA
jgi:hypothetical protein